MDSILKELDRLQKGINNIKKEIEKSESDREALKNIKNEGIDISDFKSKTLFDNNEYGVHGIIKNLIENSELDDLFGDVKSESKSESKYKSKPGVEVIDRGKVISDKFCIHVETLYSAKYEIDGDKTIIKMPINTNIKKVEDIEYISTDNDDIDNSKFIIKHTPSGESLDLFINVTKTRKNEDDIFVFNTDENCLYEKTFLRTIFRKSKYWESKPFIEYNSDGTVKSQNFNKGDLELVYINGKGELIQIPFENVIFI